MYEPLCYFCGGRVFQITEQQYKLSLQEEKKMRAFRKEEKTDPNYNPDNEHMCCPNWPNCDPEYDARCLVHNEEKIFAKTLFKKRKIYAS